MGFRLKDIIDLEFLVELDETAAEAGQEDLAARDRDIFRQINTTGLSETDTVLEWLSYRKLLFFHQTGSDQRLPGDLFDALLAWAGRGFFLGGFFLGLIAVTSFLAYHGTRPVNVTVFIFVFILLQALFSFIALAAMTRRAAGGEAGAPGPSAGPGVVRGFKTPGTQYPFLRGAGLNRAGGFAGLLGRVNRAHNGILFWPFFILTTVFALGFSCGALGGTLFRIAVADLAFGWQSTLLTSGGQVRELVGWIALPWSWWLPGALPGLEQIEGSRIVLKEGIAGLATEHLTAWWPFLCMGLLTYGVGLRLLVAGLACRARAAALAAADISQPRFQRLLARMRSPKMETRVRDWPVDRTTDPPRPPRPGTEHGAGEEIPAAAGKTVPDSAAAGACTEKPPAVLLASDRVCPEPELRRLMPRVEDQLGVTAGRTAAVSFDFDSDREGLLALAGSGLTVIFLQEVWQPPIRGLLHYYTRVREELFPDSRVWILLIQTPGQGDTAVPAGDMDYKVWKTAVSRLDRPGLILERMLP